MSKRLRIMILVGFGLLLTPLIAMQFTDEVDWNSIDFVLASVLIFGTIFLIEGLFYKVKENKRRLVIITALLIALIITWAELAVGIF